MLHPEEIIARLGLQPLEFEGGFYAETYRARLEIPPDALGERYDGARAAATAIYYLLTRETCSRLHRLASDEIFHFYLGDPVEMLLLHPDGTGRRTLLGPDLRAGMVPQHVVPHGAWQGARLRTGGAWALLGTTVAPGFAREDFELGRRTRLQTAYPAFAGQIAALTPSPPQSEAGPRTQA
ncbi:MAG: cupin domain-containing protein [Candidatus Eisenbacteria bacterium]|nr:cupin domain-containing protein [Candidatus Eisenbacteria bacterium]